MQPADVPSVSPTPPSATAAFPGADALLAGFDLSGEAGLRHGDRLLYGITLHAGGTEPATRHMLQIEVDRDDATLDTEWWRISLSGPSKMRVGGPSRPMSLALLLTDADGVELQRSRIERTHDVYFESSFVDGVLAQQRDETLPVGIASLQLLEICNLLGSDAILKRLLDQVASVPFDLSLLWRRDLGMEVDFDLATPISASAEVPTTGAPQPEFDLPFDLYLNDSLLVRMSAAVATPRGPTGAAAGIVRMTAQQAKQPGPRLELELLAAARGPSSDFAAHGAAAFLGYDNEGVALAFSPDGRFVAMPGRRGVVELRDLRREDPTVPARLLGASDEVEALHFLDAKTLLVARGKAIEVFGCGAVAVGDELRPRATIAVSPLRTPCAIEPAGPHSVFVGSYGAGVERWTFGAPEDQPVREPVVAPQPHVGRDSNGVELKAWLKPPLGWLLGGRGDDRCLIRWTPPGSKVETETRMTRGDDGNWTASPQPWVAEPAARRQRWDGESAPMPWDEVAVGHTMSLLPDLSGHGAVAEMICVARGSVRMLGRAHFPPARYCHGFAPGGAFYACVGPGHRVLARVPSP